MRSPDWESPDGSIRLFHAPCEEVLPTLESESVDVCVVDPPYLNLKGGYVQTDLGGVASRINDSVSLGDEWGANLDWVPDIQRICRLGAIVCCSHHGLPETAMAFIDWRRAVLWTWHKRNAPPTGKNVPRFSEEYAWGFAKRPGLDWDAIQSTLIDIPKLATGCFVNSERVVDASKKAIHPAQKPIGVMLRLLEVVPASLTVIDHYMGLGTTGVACARRKIKFIGIERENTPERPYFNIAVDRIKAELARFPLFEPSPTLKQTNLLGGT